ncbi:MAG: hypothetical protein ACI9QC_000008 [Oceanicoccus sp.]|jgi:hypothetical protein
MLKISDALSTIINVNSFLKAGLSHRLFNLSQLARYLKPLVEARLQKEVKESAILMNLSRIQRDFTKTYKLTDEFLVQKISVQANLFTATFAKTPAIHKQVNDFYKWIQKYKGFISISESSKEITIIVELGFLERMPEFIKDEPIFIKKNITGIGVQFDAEYTKSPGFLYLVLQKTSLQGVNLVEVFSTYTEFMIFVDHEDTKLAFDTLYSCFKGF